MWPAVCFIVWSSHLLGVNPLGDADLPRHLDKIRSVSPDKMYWPHLDALGPLHQPRDQHRLHGALLHGLQVALLARGGDQHAASLVMANLEKAKSYKMFNYLPRDDKISLLLFVLEKIKTPRSSHNI